MLWGPYELMFTRVSITPGIPTFSVRLTFFLSLPPMHSIDAVFMCEWDGGRIFTVPSSQGSSIKKGREHQFFTVLFPAPLIIWNKGQFTAQMFITLDTLASMAGIVSSQTKKCLKAVRPDDGFIAVYCIVLQISIFCAHNCPGPADSLCFHSVLVSQNVCISRAITASWLPHTYPIMLLSCTQQCLFMFSTLCYNMTGPDLNLSIGVSLLAVCAIYQGKGGAEICACAQCQRRHSADLFSEDRATSREAAGRGEGKANSAKTAKTQPFQSPLEPESDAVETEMGNHQWAEILMLWSLKKKKSSVLKNTYLEPKGQGGNGRRILRAPWPPSESK